MDSPRSALSSRLGSLSIRAWAPSILVCLLGCASLSDPQGVSDFDAGERTGPQTASSPAVEPRVGSGEFFRIDVDRLAERQPADVFVLPVSDESGSFNAPLAGLRKAYYAGLVGRLYTPIELAFGDERMQGLPGNALRRALDAEGLDAQGLVQLRLLRWDTRALESRGHIDAELEAVWMDTAAPDGEPLYAATLGRPVELSGRQVRGTTRPELEQRAAEILIRDLLGRLPMRQASQAAPR